MMRLHLHFRPMFRSYKPVTETLQESVLPEAAPGEVADRVREELDNEHRGVEIEQLDFTNLGRVLQTFELHTFNAIRVILYSNCATVD